MGAIGLKSSNISTRCPERNFDRVIHLVEHNTHHHVEVLVSAHRRRSRGFRAAACLKYEHLEARADTRPDDFIATSVKDIRVHCLGCE